MLTKTFIHCDGIGSHKEAQLWKAGITSWDECLQDQSQGKLPVKAIGPMQARVKQSVAALKQFNGAFFNEHMPSNEMWRLYPELKEQTAFIDIETTGLSPQFDDITIISIFDQSGARALIKGKDLDAFPELISNYSVLVTFNGKCFDMPMLHHHFPEFKKRYAHIDLRYDLARLGFRGGLKSIERQLGIDREGALAQVDGFMAVLLWRAHEQGSKTALDTLVRYALEDVLNMKPLLEFVYNDQIKKLPIEVDKIKPDRLPEVDVPYDENLIERLLRY